LLFTLSITFLSSSLLLKWVFSLHKKRQYIDCSTYCPLVCSYSSAKSFHLVNCKLPCRSSLDYSYELITCRLLLSVLLETHLNDFHLLLTLHLTFYALNHALL